MSEVPILKETTRTTGREALRNNITAAMALAGAVRTTLGPLGQDKLLIDDEGRTMVTNDGVTVLESAKVEHPVARMLINASTTQDRIAQTTERPVPCFSQQNCSKTRGSWCCRAFTLRPLHEAIASPKKRAGNISRRWSLTPPSPT